MNEKALRTIYNCISNAKDAIEMLACENYPFTEFMDADLGEMFYQLNSMCIAVTRKIEALKK